MKATEQYFAVMLLFMLYKMVLTFECWEKILECDHSFESYRRVLSCGTVRYILKHRVNLKQHYPCNIAPLTNCPVSQDLLSNFSHEIPTFLRCLYVCLSTPFVGDLCYHLSWYIAWDLVTPLAYGKYNIYNSTLCFMFLLSTSARFLKCWEFWTSM